MKKVWSWFICIMLCLAVFTSAYAEAAEFSADSVFDLLARYEWSFSSGAGGWSTDVNIRPDGSFEGTYHDSEMGETGDGYPNGTLYGCAFSGKMSIVGQVDENTLKIRIDRLTPDEGQVPEAIDDGIRYVTSEIYGLSEGDEMLLYRPGTPVNVLSEDMQMWAHVHEYENPSDVLKDWFLSSEKNDSGFVGYEVSAGIANPWSDLTAEELAEASGISFGIPEGAENVIYRYLRDENLAEMQFTIGNDEFCVRILPVTLQDGEWMSISGIYFEWENEEAVSVGPYQGTVGQAKTGSEDHVELCQWYNTDLGRMYSVSVYTTDPDGLDLTAIAEQIGAASQTNP